VYTNITIFVFHFVYQIYVYIAELGVPFLGDWAAGTESITSTQRKQGLLGYNKYNLSEIQQNSSAGILEKRI
jgi:hypothetical protein